jgi:DNA-binding transcriptional LysR family regulator
MEFRQVRYFVAVAEELHFGRAAARLFMAQSPLSQQIRRLEGELGAELFDRTRRQVTLTPAGEAFLPEARKLVSQFDRARDAARLTRDGTAGTLVVGCATSAFYDVLPALLAVVRSERPGISISVRELGSVDAIAAVAEGRIDVAVAHMAAHPPEVEFHVLRSEKLAAVLPVTHPLASLRSIPIESLRAEPFVMLPRRMYAEMFDAVLVACRNGGFSPEIAEEAQSFISQVGMVACGIGIALLPGMTRKFAVPGVIYRPLSPRTVLPDLALAWNTNRPPSTLHLLRSSVGIEIGVLAQERLPITAVQTERRAKA